MKERSLNLIFVWDYKTGYRKTAICRKVS